MIRTAVGFVAPLLLLAALHAGDKAEKLTPEQQYRKLVQEFRKAEDQAKPKFDWLFLDLAKNNPKTNTAVYALTWILGYTYDSSDPRSPRAQALKILIRDHVESEKMAAVCQIFRMVRSGVESRKLLHAVLEKNPHRSAKAQACLALAIDAESNISLASELKEKPDEAKGYERFMGKEYVQALIKAKPEDLKKEVEVLYERMAKDFADVPRLVLRGVDEENAPKPSGYTFGEFAKAKLEALRHPVLVGKPAPEIEGKDIEGKKFKLSDYRGKIVLLVFWWDWELGQSTLPDSYFDDERSLVKRLAGKPFILIGVNKDVNRDELKKVMIKEKLSWSSFLDGGGTFGGPICTRWDVGGGSARFLIDAKGVIRHKHLGYPNRKALHEEIDRLVAEVEKTAKK